MWLPEDHTLNHHHDNYGENDGGGSVAWFQSQLGWKMKMWQPEIITSLLHHQGDEENKSFNKL